MIKLIRETIREMLTQSPEMKVISVGGFPITVEIAGSLGDQQLGLMHREHLEPDCGMLFCYDDPRELSFWMRNTHIPLSIAFIDDESRISSIHDMEPHSEDSIVSSVPCRWALETNRDWFTARNLRVGAKVSGLGE